MDLTDLSDHLRAQLDAKTEAREQGLSSSRSAIRACGNAIKGMDYPDGITFGLRRLTDVARSIIERTRGDFTTSTIQKELRDALEAHASRLGES